MGGSHNAILSILFILCYVSFNCIICGVIVNNDIVKEGREKYNAMRGTEERIDCKNPHLAAFISYAFNNMSELLDTIEELRWTLTESRAMVESRDEKITKLEACLIEAMEWNWLDKDAPPRFDLNNLPNVSELGGSDERDGKSN